MKALLVAAGLVAFGAIAGAQGVWRAASPAERENRYRAELTRLQPQLDAALANGTIVADRISLMPDGRFSALGNVRITWGSTTVTGNQVYISNGEVSVDNTILVKVPVVPLIK